MIWGDVDDPVKRWRAQADRAEQEHLEEKRRMQREQERRERDIARASASAEISALDARLTAIESQLEGLNELARAVVTFSDAVNAKLAKLEELLARHAELREADSRQSTKSFEGFAREKSGEIVDLPEFLARKTVN
jgi:hypothetical protein